MTTIIIKNLTTTNHKPRLEFHCCNFNTFALQYLTNAKYFFLNTFVIPSLRNTRTHTQQNH
ncbi:hypothetical protein FF38_04742 [Lucilia cuprina]|uniref:Uncharacterized protein n=1 Tax=Lucilia cuprina TaxID=7375 RepID=A0A0L0CPW3_LUCCU|nr:hypothetical protein CVS40_0981 [Lucilia cuprina]KNC34232.1 hypothetical protein FF38_04742 [Lucilia cuprina]